MDVLCVGMYRACSTWQYEVAAHLVEKHRGGLRLGYLTGPQYEARLPDRPGGMDGWRAVKSHEGHPRFDQALADRSAIALYAFRDLREVVYSMLHKRGVSFEQFLERGMIHQLLANDRHWRRHKGVLVQRYEHLVTDPTRGVDEIAAHLGIALAPGEAERVAQAYSPAANRKRIEALGHRLARDGVDLADPANLQLYDSTTLLHWNHMRGERTPSWRELATPFHIETLDRLCSAWLIENGYEPDRSWAQQPAGSESPERGALDRLQSRAQVERRLARGWLACQLRCATLRHPHTASAVKSLLPLPAATAPTARAWPTASGPLVDAA